MGKIVIISVLVFLVIVLLLVSVLLYARKKLVPSGDVKININNKKDIEVQSGSSILATLANEKIFLPSACGGQGTCGMCKCKVIEGGGEMLPTEKPHFTRRQQQENYRLGCQVKVKEDMKIYVSCNYFTTKSMIENVLNQNKDALRKMINNINRQNHNVTSDKVNNTLNNETESYTLTCALFCRSTPFRGCASPEKRKSSREDLFKQKYRDLAVFNFCKRLQSPFA